MTQNSQSTSVRCNECILIVPKQNFSLSSLVLRNQQFKIFHILRNTQELPLFYQGNKKNIVLPYVAKMQVFGHQLLKNLQIFRRFLSIAVNIPFNCVTRQKSVLIFFLPLRKTGKLQNIYDRKCDLLYNFVTQYFHIRTFNYH